MMKIAACPDCPFRRDAKPLLDDKDPAEFYNHYIGGTAERGMINEYSCSGQKVCSGQRIMLANQNVIEGPIDREGFFWLNNEFIRYHREGYIFGARWMKEYRANIGKPIEVKEKNHLDLF